MKKLEERKENFDKLVNRVNRAYGCFLLWKYIRKSISIPEVGQKEAERRLGIMNNYGGIFTGILYATENTFIIDLHKFFDKSKNALKLETFIRELLTEDKDNIVQLIKSIKKELGRIETLRHNVSAHEPKKPKEEKIFSQEVERIFSVVQKILNIISKSVDGRFMTWDLWEGETIHSFDTLVNDLERGHNSNDLSTDRDESV